jgi:hypothetical protein
MRQYKIFVLAIQVILVNQGLYCGFERTPQPSIVLGRALTGTAQRQFENLWLNPASISSAVTFHSSVFYTPSPFDLPQMSNGGFIAGSQTNGISFAGGYSTFGFSLYRETIGTMTLAATVAEGIDVGINGHLYHVSIANYGSRTAGIADVGAVYSLTDQFSIGCSVLNMTGSDFGEDDDIPRYLTSGISVNITERSVVNFDLVSETRYPLTYRAGVELSVHERVTLRAGVQGDQSRIFAGVSLAVLSFRIDYAAATHQELGLTHSIGISFE